MNLQPLAPRVVDRDQLVLDGFLEDCAETVEQTSYGSRPERDDLAVALVTQVRTGIERLLEFVRLFDLVLPERGAEFSVDFIEAVTAEEGQQVAPQHRAIAAVRLLAEWLLADQTFELRPQPVGGVLVERRHLHELLFDRRLWFWPLPNAGLDARDDVPQLDTGGALAPPAAAAAVAVTLLVQHQRFASPVGGEAQTEAERPVHLLFDLQASCDGPCHQARSRVEVLPCGCTGTLPPVVGPGAFARCPAAYLARRW